MTARTIASSLVDLVGWVGTAVIASPIGAGDIDTSCFVSVGIGLVASGEGKNVYALYVTSFANVTDKRRRDIPASFMDLGEIEEPLLVSGGFLSLRGESGGPVPLPLSSTVLSGFGVVNVSGEDGEASAGLFRFE